MYSNWSEIIEIMKPVLSSNRSRSEKKMALGSCLRTLGWRTSTGTMHSDYKLNSGQIIDIVLGNNAENGEFIGTLPIQISTDDSNNELLDQITTIMVEMNIRIAIVLGKSFDLLYFDDNIQKAVLVGNISFELKNEDGLRFSSLLLAQSYNATEMIAYFESLYKAKLPSMKLETIINSIITDKAKSEEVLRTYLELEGFEGELIDNVCKHVGIEIFYKDSKVVESAPKITKAQEKQSGKTSHDNTRFSLDGGIFLSKRNFVREVVAKYIKDHPGVTLDELEMRFPSEIASKVRGVVRTLSQVRLWANQNGPDILTRYCTKENEILRLQDGTEIVVNSQWGSKNFPKFLALAKTLYNISSDAPYEVLVEKGHPYIVDAKDEIQDSNVEESAETSNGIQISLHSYNSFKTKK